MKIKNVLAAVLILFAFAGFNAAYAQTLSQRQAQAAAQQRLTNAINNAKRNCNIAFPFRSGVQRRDTLEVREACFKTVEDYLRKIQEPSFPRVKCLTIDDAVWEYQARLNGARSLDFTAPQFEAYMMQSAMDVGLMYSCIAIPWD